LTFHCVADAIAGENQKTIAFFHLDGLDIRQCLYYLLYRSLSGFLGSTIRKALVIDQENRVKIETI